MFLFHKPSFLFILSITIFRPVIINSADSSPYGYCSNSSEPQTPSSTKNLNTFLDSLSSKASTNSFYKDSSDNIYGLFLCRGDVSTNTCQTCVNKARQGIRNICPLNPNNKTAIIWLDMCMLRYSDVSFFGSVETEPKFLAQSDSKVENTNFKAMGLIYNLVDQALQSPIMYAAAKEDGPNSLQPKYGMVQCVRDLNSSGCRTCLSNLTDYMDECCKGMVGWRIIAPSCTLRYELFPFFVQPSATAPSGGKRGNGIVKIVVITLSSLAAVAALLSFYLWYRKRRSKEEGDTEEVLSSKYKTSTYPSSTEGGTISFHEDKSGEARCLSLATIDAATNGFADDNKLGEGGFGPVYKGKLPNGIEIAVKRLSIKSNQGLDEFKNEIMLILKLQHKNLVRLLGYCWEKDEKLLVYEYMANTSLDTFLFDSNKKLLLDWPKRFDIILGISKGLLYLHRDSFLRVIHRDLKVSNILLDDNINPKISDFGLARSFQTTTDVQNTRRIAGTLGYMSPEYAMRGIFSEKSDVFSFGVLLLEIVTGKKNTSSSYSAEHLNLIGYAWHSWNEGKVLELIDPVVGTSISTLEVARCIHVGLLCVQDNPSDRPAMPAVVQMLSMETDRPQPTEPSFTFDIPLESYDPKLQSLQTVNEVTISIISGR